MNANFKYLTHNPEDERWGLYLMVAGSARIEPGIDYPPKGHPVGYNFNSRFRAFRNARIASSNTTEALSPPR